MRYALVLMMIAAGMTPSQAQSKLAAPKLSPAVPFAEPRAPQGKQTQGKPAVVKPVSESSSEPAEPSATEQALLDAANREREARGLQPFEWNVSLASAARTHAQKMAQAGTLSHQFPGEMNLGYRVRMAELHFTKAAENVALGPSAAVIHKAWMNSPPHRDNLLDRELDSIGIAVVERDGQLFAVQDFSRANP
jgi:uncharacterized protein YkwD